MLQIQQICKKYRTGDFEQIALDHVSFNLRDNEFVAILGPSGSGKTTLLNIIGGLDRYDSGDLIIDGTSTKKYKDRDWDSYRNHTVGFVFQSYNLIPHQTILENVELALTISGVNSTERKQRALDVLDRVGLKEQAHKLPNQMSGGQMQRVAIARAMINNPTILLADEPTGALDTETSLQVMDLLKEVAKDHLVVMVTHNPELAEQYANRIIRLKDGRITEDTNAFDTTARIVSTDSMGKTSMNFFTALSLSLRNLMTKKLRTFMTAFAGSIGILGISLILSVSSGVQNYIDQMQEETLSTYPLTIESETADTTSIITSIMGTITDAFENDADVTEAQVVSSMFAQIGTNDISAFKNRFENAPKQLKSGINAVQYTYGVRPLIYSGSFEYGVVQLNPSKMFTNTMAQYMSMSSMSGTMNMFQQMVDNQELLDSQYELLIGKWPEQYDEVIMIISEKHAISDFMVYSLGWRDPAELKEMIQKVMAGEEATYENEAMSWSYEDFLNTEFKMVLPGNLYKYNKKYNVYEDMTDDTDYMKEVIKDGVSLKVVGVIAKKSGVSAACMQDGIAYRSDLIDYIIKESYKSPIVQKQLNNEDVDVFSGKTFEELQDESDDKGTMDFEDMISIDENALKNAFGMDVDQKTIEKMISDSTTTISDSLTTDTSAATKKVKDTFTYLAKDMINSYIETHADPESGMAILSGSDIAGMVSGYMSSESANSRMQKLTDEYMVPTDAYKNLYSPLLTSLLQAYLTSANEVTEFEESLMAPLMPAMVDSLVSGFAESAPIQQAFGQLGTVMTEAKMKVSVLTEVGTLSGSLIKTLTGGIKIDTDAFASAFKFNLDEDELSRLMSAYLSADEDANYITNLAKLGYADINKPTAMSIYLKDFDAKEQFKAFVEDYNAEMEQKGKDEYVINYTDITGILMSSVKSIVDAISYVLIAFVAISLIVSSIMIGVITLISVMERTKEIGILRAIGASKKDISRVFNAETFIIGLCAGLLGVGIAELLLIPINAILLKVTNIATLRAYLPPVAAVILVIISIVLTLISGLIPSSSAAKMDPVKALRSE